MLFFHEFVNKKSKYFPVDSEAQSEEDLGRTFGGVKAKE